MTIQLRDYQETVFGEARALVAKGERSVLIQMSTGAGKTAVGGKIIHRAIERGARTHLWVHRRELLKQSVLAMDKEGVPCGIIAAGFPSNPRAPVQICSIQSLARRVNTIERPNLVIVDECFVAGSMVGDIPIESIRVGSIVDSWDETLRQFVRKRVIRTFMNRAPDRLYKLTINDKIVVCTGNHPILSAVGWRTASQLKTGDIIYGMHNVRSTHEQKQTCSVRPVLSRCDGGTESIRGTRTHEESKSNGGYRNAEQNVDDTQKNWSQAEYSRRQWSSHASSSTDVVPRDFWARVRSCRQDWARTRWQWLSNMLQVGLGYPAIEAWNRMRRRVSRIIGAKGKRPQEGPVLIPERLDRIEVLEQRSSGEFERLCPDGFVYNFEVEGTHTYTVNGIIVHNCHHAASTTLSSLINYYNDAVVIGLTASPWRLDGAGLRPWFKTMVCGPSTRDLIRMGWLSNYRVFGPPRPIDLSGVGTVGGDFNRKELAAKMKASQVTGDAVKHYQSYIPGKRAIAFLYSIESSIEMAARFNAAGISAVHIDGETPDDLRDHAIRGFSDGAIKVICNVDIISEGFDVPSCQAIFMLRPTKSLTLFLQQIGRGLRIAEGKEHVFLFDHADNIIGNQHGLPDDDREWSLDGRKKRKKSDDSEGPMLRMCPKCHEVSRLSVRICPCGYKLVMERELEIDKDADLHELNPEELRRQRFQEQGRAQTLEALIAVGRRNGYKHPDVWARHIIRAREEKRARIEREKAASAPPLIQQAEAPRLWLDF